MCFRCAILRLKTSFLLTIVIFSSMWCVTVFFKSQQTNLEDNKEIKLFPLSVEYNGSVVSSMYERGFDISANICGTKKQTVQLLVIIISTSSEESARESIRHTWKAFSKMKNVSMAFMLGRTTNVGLTARVQAESRLYGDIIVTRNLDSFNNLTLKSIAIAEWVSENCPGARFVVKADSDVFFNVPHLFEIIETNKAIGSHMTVYGNILHNTEPLRNHGYKHWVSEEEYSAEKYPDYVQGGAYMFTGDLARRQFSTALDMNFFRMEDVFFTGLLSERLGARLIHVDDFLSFSSIGSKASLNNRTQDNMDACDLRKKLAVHHGHYDRMFHLWELLNDRSLKCSCACS